MTRTTRGALALLLLLLGPDLARGTECRDDGPIALWTSPRHPDAGAPLRAIAVARAAAPVAITIHDPDGRPLGTHPVRHDGPPTSLVATIEAPRPGTYRIEARSRGGLAACREVQVVAEKDPPGQGASAWSARRDWNADTEALWAAWIEHLFGAAEGQKSTLSGLADVLRDPDRNFLHDHMRLGEDGPGARALALTPDCADLPYVLRAYFAWKLELPFGFRACDRGSARTPPRCTATPRTNALPAGGGDPLSAFKGFAHTVVDGVHSGSARTALGDDDTDFYPVPLTHEALRPGTVYADPYGHTLMIVRWVPQTAERSGVLIAVDAQPDESMGYKRFWEGTFLFADLPGAGPGFKAFRPLVGDDGGPPRPLGNDVLRDGGEHVPYSSEQATLDADEFYARMQKLINPAGLPPGRAYDTTMDALVEQLETRLGSVDTGEQWMRAHPGTVVAMPEGGAIFETIGPWEDYATPSRDMRMLLAMRVLEELPARVEKHPDLFVLRGNAPADVRAGLDAVHAREVKERAITYRRTDGSEWKVTVEELLERRPALETAYNPNDCVEVRWGAPEGSEEHATCRRRAPASQQARMDQYRPWFREQRRPPR